MYWNISWWHIYLVSGSNHKQEYHHLHCLLVLTVTPGMLNYLENKQADNFTLLNNSENKPANKKVL